MSTSFQGNLYDFLQARRDKGEQVAWALRLRIARDIAEGMKFLHSATPPIIHRDLKSPNVLVPAFLHFTILLTFNI
jgi:serine/threonine protein kinase